MWAITISLALVAVVTFFFVYFNKEIRVFINRIKSVEHGKTRIDSRQVEQQPAEKESDVTDRLMRALDSPALRETEAWVKGALEQAGVSKSPDKEKILFRFLAATELENRFLRIDHAIWGSQIYILENLNSFRNVGLPIEQLKTWYDQSAAKYPSLYMNYSYKQYIEFLKSFGLVIQENGGLRITTLGVEFLAWLDRQGESGARFRAG